MSDSQQVIIILIKVYKAGLLCLFVFAIHFFTPLSEGLPDKKDAKNPEVTA